MSDTPPLVSVLFATRDRAAQLAHTLSAYRALDTDGLSWELVVVDNASRDETADVLRQAGRDLPLRCLRVEGGGQNRARNQALDIVRGSLVVFTDDDVLIDPGCLRAYVDAAARWPDEAIFGARIDPRFPPDTPHWLSDPTFTFGSTAFARYAPRSDEGPVPTHPFGPSFAVRASVLDGQRFPEHLGPQAGSYAMGGEAVFLRRIAARGYRYIHVPAARVQHIVRNEQIAHDWLLRRAYNRGRGQAHLPGKRRRSSGLCIAGVPVRLWLAVTRSWLRYRLAGLFCSNRHRISRGITYQLRRGEAMERRRLSRQTDNAPR